MELSSPRFKSLAVTAGFSFWFFIITTVVGIFSLEFFAGFVVILLIVTQIFALKLSKGLDIFAVINTKIFLGILFVFVFTAYGIFFKVLQIDVFRLKRQKDTYWFDVDQLKSNRIFKQYLVVDFRYFLLLS